MEIDKRDRLFGCTDFTVKEVNLLIGLGAIPEEFIEFHSFDGITVAHPITSFMEIFPRKELGDNWIQTFDNAIRYVLNHAKYKTAPREGVLESDGCVVGATFCDTTQLSRRLNISKNKLEDLLHRAYAQNPDLQVFIMTPPELGFIVSFFLIKQVDKIGLRLDKFLQGIICGDMRFEVNCFEVNYRAAKAQAPPFRLVAAPHSAPPTGPRVYAHNQAGDDPAENIRGNEITQLNEPTVDVLGHQITAVLDEDGSLYVPLKRLCEILSIDPSGQRAKVRHDQRFRSKMLVAAGKDGKKCKMLCLPTDKLEDWVLNVNSNQVRPDLRDALVQYQQQILDTRNARRTDKPSMAESPQDLDTKAPDSSGVESEHSPADDTPEETIAEDRKERAYNCLGNLRWLIDAFLIWVEEMIDMDGDYSPGPHLRKATREELEDYVRRTRCTIRVMQAAVDAARHYEKLDSGINAEGLAELHSESWALYESLEELIRELSDDHSGLVATDHPALNYLAGPCFEAMSYTGFEIVRNFHVTIIPPAES